MRKKIASVLFITFVLNVLGGGFLNTSVKAETRPKMTGVEMVNKSPKEGDYPTLKLSSKGCSQVQYSVYLYSPEKKVWENVSNGYTSPVSGETSHTIKLKKPLHKGENSFSVWVKKANATPIDKGGYDDFESYKVNISGSSTILPEIKSVNIDSSQQKVGVSPTLKITSTGSEQVQYRVYLYSPSKKVWEDVSGGYTSAQNPSTVYNLKSNTALHKGENSFSVWVKRAGKDPAKKEGYDNFLSYKINVSEEASSSLPEIKSVSIDSSQQKVGVSPTLKITSTGNEQVQYRVYLYSPSKKVWEDVSGGYTSAQNPSTVYNLKSNAALHKGENSFSVWVKRAGKDPAKKEGYDNFLSYKINVSEEATPSAPTLPEITNVSIDESQVKLGGTPKVYLTSTCASNVQYSIYLYSPSKRIWENVSNGYTTSVNPNTPYAIDMRKPLQPGSNTLSIWVKRAGQAPTDPGGYDSYVHKVINVDINTAKTTKISSLLATSDNYVSGQKPEIQVNASAGDGSNIAYKTFLYSDKDKTWVESSSFTSPIPSGQSTKITLNTSLKEGNNKILLWAKRAWYEGDVYEDYRVIEINAKQSGPVKKKIVVDAGHGGVDGGAVSYSGQTNERNITLAVSLKLGDVLKSKGYDVIYTRTDNTSVAWDSSSQTASLRYRANFANENNADLFVSVHCNSATPSAYGTETYYSTTKSSKDKTLATDIHTELIKSIGLRDRGVKTANHYVTVNTKMPASLVELAFISNQQEEAKLRDPQFQQKAANGIANGIINFLRK